MSANWNTLRSHFAPWRRQLVKVGVLSVVAAALDAAVLVALAPLLANLTVEGSAISGTLAGFELEVTMTQLLLLTGFLVALRAVVSLLTRFTEARLLADYEAVMRARLIRLFLAAAWSVQASERAGRLQQFIGGHIGRSQVALRALSLCLTSASGLVILTSGAVVVGGPATLLGLVVIVLVGVTLRPLQRVSKEASAEQAVITPIWTAEVAETTAMARETRLFQVGHVVYERASSTLERIRRLRERELSFTNSAPIFYETAGLALVLIGVAAVRATNPDNLTAIGAAAILLIRALMHGRNLQNQYQQVSNLVPFVDGLDRQVTMYASSTEPDGERALDRIDSVEFRAVSFRYETAGPDILEAVSLSISAGTSLGIIGPSGAGKSTLLELLLRLRRATGGEVIVNGVPIDEYTASSLHRRIRFVPQDPRLFDASVRDNVTSFGEDPDEAVWEALRAAGLDEEIRRFGGLDASVGQLGTKLSGGQRQRLAIARALIGDPDVLVMDEPTGALDAHSEAAVQETLHRSKPHVALVIVAHRLSTLELCDQILVLQQGRVVAQGDRDELQVTNSYYQDALRISGMS